LRHSFITAALDDGARGATCKKPPATPNHEPQTTNHEPRTTMRYDRARQSLDRHATYIVATLVAGASRSA